MNHCVKYVDAKIAYEIYFELLSGVFVLIY